MSDAYDDFPIEIREEAKEISRRSKTNGITDNDLLNKLLKELWEANADKLGVPLGSKLLITPEFLEHLRTVWKWPEEAFGRLITADHAIASEYRGGGVCLTMPDGTWIGGMDPSELGIVRRMRQAWVEQKGNE